MLRARTDQESIGQVYGHVRRQSLGNTAETRPKGESITTKSRAEAGERSRPREAKHFHATLELGLRKATTAETRTKGESNTMRRQSGSGRLLSAQHRGESERQLSCRARASSRPRTKENAGQPLFMVTSARSGDRPKECVHTCWRRRAGSRPPPAASAGWLRSPALGARVRVCVG